MRWAQRLVPPWLLIRLADLTGRIILFRHRDSFDKNSPTHRGIHLWLEGANAELYLDHLKPAIDLIDTYGPVYLRWIRTRFNAIVVSQLFMIMRTVTAVDVRRRFFAAHPYTVWRFSAEELALYLVGGATRGRLGRRFTRRGARVRADRCVLEEMIAFARRLPGSQELVTKWEHRLAEFNEHFPPAAA